MQTLAAYLMFLLVIVAFGLAIILGGVIVIAAYEGAKWIKSRPKLPTWERAVFAQCIRAKVRIERELDVLHQAVRLTLHARH